MPERKSLDRHFFTFNPQDNGGECFSLATTYYEVGDGLFVTQDFDLGSYCNSASIHLSGETITSNEFRRLANELDQKLARLQMPNPPTPDKVIETHSFVFQISRGDNTLSLETHFFDNGDRTPMGQGGVPNNVYINQFLKLESHGNVASINLCGATISSAALRKLANQLDAKVACLPEPASW